MLEVKYSKNYQSFREGIISCSPTILGYLGIGIAAGVVGKSAQLSLMTIALLSLIVYAGSAQFIISGMLMVSSPVSAIVFTTFLVNLRHFLMSMSVASYFQKESLISSIGIGSLLTDESYGVMMTAIQRGKKISPAWTNGLNITAYLTWFISTIIGGILGSWLPNPESIGLDYALLAMFIGLIILQIDLPIKDKTKPTLIILFSVIFSLYFFMGFFSPEISVLLSTLLGCSIGMWVYE